uniref:Large ribosomal subunit protein bL20c n=1 Tax=Lens culinaris TaxID=3864 RepID=A0A023INF6_LENCU|nr:ribosomal protein L20 [Lens culinaris]AGW45921.1 ribosomal protein L20 [Lens culinaris]AIL56081.1 ribosomal protein L20 [Lens culinaris]
MNRIKKGSSAQKRKTKTDFFTSRFRAAPSSIIRMILQKRRKALLSSQRDRDKKKRDFRSLWISRINAIIGQKKEKLYYSYSNLMYNLYKNQLLVNRKIVAQIAILKGNFLFLIANDIILIQK